MAHIILHPGDNRISLAAMAENSVDSVVCDPPYGYTSITKRMGAENASPVKYGSDGAFVRVSKGFMGKCFHPATEVMTKKGWRFVDAMSLGETVATLNPETRELEWQEVEQVHRYPFDGHLVHVKHRSTEQIITPNHKMLVSFDGGTNLELVEPGNLKSHFHLFAQAHPTTGSLDPVVIESERVYGVDRELVRIDRKEFDPFAFFKFFGLWLGDGYCVTRTDDHPANDFCGINVKKERKKVAVRSSLADLGVKFTETEQENGISAFYIYDFALLGFLKTIGKAKKKFIPNHFFDWDSSVLESLYRGLIETDGTVQGQDQEVFFTSSKQLAEDFQRLCLHTGRSAANCFKPAGKEVEICGRMVVSSDSWVCYVLKPGKRMYGEKSASSSNVMHDAPYTGEVFCIGVPKHHIIYTRFNGKPVWTGNSWDGSGIERDPEFWKLVMRVLKPGGYIVAFSASRTYHRMAVAIEDAGFITHPMIGWLNGQGFPKAHAADKAIDKMLGKEGAVIAQGGPVKRMIPGADQLDTGSWLKDNGREYQPGQYQPATPEAAEWGGWAYGGQVRKPALEPIYVGQKPFSEKSGAANILKWGVGAVNVDGCRVPTDEVITNHSRGVESSISKGKYGDSSAQETHQTAGQTLGRYPANLITDGSPEVVALFPTSSVTGKRTEKSKAATVEGTNWLMDNHQSTEYTDSGSAARFFESYPFDGEPAFYQAKAGKSDRAGSKHPTVKPIALMQALVRHVTPPGGTVLDPFAGSGTTGEAALREGFNCILMEAEPEYIEFLTKRFNSIDAAQSKTSLDKLLHSPVPSSTDLSNLLI